MHLRVRKKLLAKYYNFVMITPAAADYRGFIKVDEVDGRSPVERAAAAFCTWYSTCVDTLARAGNEGRPRVLRRCRVMQD